MSFAPIGQRSAIVMPIHWPFGKEQWMQTSLFIHHAMLSRCDSGWRFIYPPYG
jgi:hypothetical protein